MNNIIIKQKTGDITAIYPGAHGLRYRFFDNLVFINNIVVAVRVIDGTINKGDIARALNYLKASGCRVGLIINFGTNSPESKGLIF